MLTIERHTITELPDDFVVDEAVSQFGRNLIAIAASYEPDAEIAITYDRDILMEMGAMIVRCIERRRGASD